VIFLGLGLGLELMACFKGIDRGRGCRHRMAGFSNGGLNIVTSLGLLNVSVHESLTWLLDRELAHPRLRSPRRLPTLLESRRND
jgi:hypothetical protein